MTREGLRKHWKIVEAFKNGEEIEWRPNNQSYWLNITNPAFDNIAEYRVKPKWEPKPGEYIMVSVDNRNWHKRFFIKKHYNCMYRCLTEEDNCFAINMNSVSTTLWDYAKPLDC